MFPWFADGYDLDAIVCLTGNTPVARSKESIVYAENPTSLESEMVSDVSELEDEPVLLATHPNPVESVLSIALKSFTTGAISIAITDVMGKTVYTQTITLNEGKSSVSIDMSTYPKGFYVVHAANKNGSFSTTQKILKE